MKIKSQVKAVATFSFIDDVARRICIVLRMANEFSDLELYHGLMYNHTCSR